MHGQRAETNEKTKTSVRRSDRQSTQQKIAGQTMQAAKLGLGHPQICTPVVALTTILYLGRRAGHSSLRFRSMAKGLVALESLHQNADALNALGHNPGGVPGLALLGRQGSRIRSCPPR